MKYNTKHIFKNRNYLLLQSKSYKYCYRAQTITKADKRRLSPTSTMKPMSAHDEKTLNTAVALANEITSK